MNEGDGFHSSCRTTISLCHEATASPVSPCDVFVVVGLQTLMGNRALTALKVEVEGEKKCYKTRPLMEKKKKPRMTRKTGRPSAGLIVKNKRVLRALLKREGLITLLLCLQGFEANCFHIEHPDAVVSA